MPEFRFDPITGRSVIVAANRAERPLNVRQPVSQLPNRICPFCVGNESLTPDAAIVFPENSDGERQWQVRIVPNLYPAVDQQCPPAADGNSAEKSSPFEKCVPAGGFHEVIIESPRHISSLTELSTDEVSIVFRAYRDRYRFFADADQIQHVIIFKNRGAAAGVSQEHIHSQLVAFPFVPPVILNELKRAAEWHVREDRCVFCDLIEFERSRKVRVVLEQERFIAFCPFASRFPYETWILPKFHQAAFETTDDEHLDNLARFLRDLLSRLEQSADLAEYNLFLHSSPFDNKHDSYYHWHIELIPRSAIIAGLEWGTGVFVNVVPPEAAARKLSQQTSQ